MLHRRGQSDERRRRMLVDDTSHEGVGKKRSSKARKGLSARPRYEEATIEKQIRISDLVPQRGWIHPLLFFTWMLGVAGLLGLHHWQQLHPGAGLEIFDLAQPTSLAAWITSIGLLAVASLSLIVYSLRRWRKSDYHTRYRVWLWIALGAIFSSAAVATSWQTAAAQGLATMTGWSLPAGTLLFWLIPASLCYSILAIRLLLEVRGCKMASMALWTAMVMYGFLVVSAIGVNTGLPHSMIVMVVGGCQLGMVAILFSGLLWYAHHVLLDIQGLLQIREKTRQSKKATGKRRGVESDAPEKTAIPQGLTDLEPTAPQRAAELVRESEFEDEQLEHQTKRSKVRRKSRSEHMAQSDIDEEKAAESSRRQQRKLSKSERKRLRKQKSRERHAA